MGMILLTCAIGSVGESRAVAEEKPGIATPGTPLVPKPREMGSTAIDPTKLQFPANFETRQTPQDAFSQLPSTTTITRLTSARPSPSSTGYRFTAIFDSAAQFPFPEFGFPNAEYGDGGPRIDRDGLIIEEGMFVQANADGRYEIRFVVRAPRIPVSLRLQLTILKSESITVGLYDTTPIREEELLGKRPPKIKFAKSSRPVGTITLPQIYLKPDRTQSDNGEDVAWLVTHKGYSRILQQLLIEENGAVNCRLLRKGTARFGESFYEILNRQ